MCFKIRTFKHMEGLTKWLKVLGGVSHDIDVANLCNNVSELKKSRGNYMNKGKDEGETESKWKQVIDKEFNLPGSSAGKKLLARKYDSLVGNAEGGKLSDKEYAA